MVSGDMTSDEMTFGRLDRKPFWRALISFKPSKFTVQNRLSVLVYPTFYKHDTNINSALI